MTPSICRLGATASSNTVASSFSASADPTMLLGCSCAAAAFELSPALQPPAAGGNCTYALKSATHSCSARPCSTTHGNSAAVPSAPSPQLWQLLLVPPASPAGVLCRPCCCSVLPPAA